jgi:Mg/Co/Ni transporter MgtE
VSNRPHTDDPLLAEVDAARRRILAECDNDPRKALESYLEYQKQFAGRLVDYSKAPRPGKLAV